MGNASVHAMLMSRVMGTCQKGEVNNVDTTAAIAWHQHNPPQLVEHVTTWGDDTVNISRDSNARGQMEEQLVRRKKPGIRRKTKRKTDPVEETPVQLEVEEQSTSTTIANEVATPCQADHGLRPRNILTRCHSRRTLPNLRIHRSLSYNTFKVIMVASSQLTLLSRP